MKTITAFSIFALCSTVLAGPSAQRGGYGGPGGNGNGGPGGNGYPGPYPYRYVTQAVANNIVEQFKIILDHSNETQARAAGDAILNPNLVVISDSILSIDLRPITESGVITTTSAEYINAIVAQPNVARVDDYFVGVTGGNQVIWHWSTQDIGSKRVRSKGFNLMLLDESLRVKELRMEFNSIAWGQDIGIVCARPTQTETT